MPYSKEIHEKDPLRSEEALRLEIGRLFKRGPDPMARVPSSTAGGRTWMIT